MRGRSLYVALFLLCCTTTQTMANNKTIHFGAMITDLVLPTNYGFQAAMQVAVDLINSDATILKDYKLKIHYGDTFRNHQSHGVRVLLGQLDNPPQKQVIIAGDFSEFSRKFLPFTTYYHVPQIAYTARQRFNPLKEIDGVPTRYTQLQDKPFPYYVRMTPSNSDANSVRVKIFQHFKWKRVAILLDDRDELLFNIANDLSRQLKEAGIEVTTTQIVREETFYSLERIDLTHALDALNSTNSRVIVALIGGIGARSLFCEVHKRKMFGPKYTWIGTDYWTEDFYVKKNDNEIPVNFNCSETQRLKAMDGMISFALMDMRSDTKPIVANMPARKIMKQVVMRQLFAKRPFPHKLVTYAFDSVLASAIAIDKLIKKYGEQATLLNGTGDDEKAQRITETILKSNFEGVTGPVYFGNEVGADDRKGTTFVRQWYSRANYTRGGFRDIASYSSFTDEFKVLKRYNNTIFNDGETRRDGTIMDHKILRVTPLSQIAALWTLTGMGVVVSIVFLAINIKYRKIRLIKMSSPNINNGIVLGSLLCYLSIILIGLDTRMFSKHSMELTCNILPVSLSIGFTFTFGCLFSKTWRVYKIFSAARTMEKVNTSALKDIRLYIIVLLLVGIDVIISMAWVLVSPFSLEEVVLNRTMVNEDTMNSYFYHKCTGEYQMHFTTVMYCYKGLLLAAGLFLAWETRNIKVAALNDSQFIGMAVYNVVIVTIVGVICFYSLTDTSNYLKHGYLIVSLSIFICTTATTIFVFAPKIRLLLSRATTLERALSVQTFSFAASVNRKSSLRKKQISPATSTTGTHRTISSENSSSNS